MKMQASVKQWLVGVCMVSVILNCVRMISAVGAHVNANGRTFNRAVLANYTVAEIIKTYHNSAKDCLLHYYRDKDSNEIDLVIESDGELHPLEIKKTANPGTELVGAFQILDKASVPRGVGAILCMRQDLSAIDRKAFVVPIWMI